MNLTWKTPPNRRAKPAGAEQQILHCLGEFIDSRKLAIR
jgi:hypothetical protein